MTAVLTTSTIAALASSASTSFVDTEGISLRSCAGATIVTSASTPGADLIASVALAMASQSTFAGLTSTDVANLEASRPRRRFPSACALHVPESESRPSAAHVLAHASSGVDAWSVAPIFTTGLPDFTAAASRETASRCAGSTSDAMTSSTATSHAAFADSSTAAGGSSGGITCETTALTVFSIVFARWSSSSSSAMSDSSSAISLSRSSAGSSHTAKLGGMAISITGSGGFHTEPGPPMGSSYTGMTVYTGSGWKISSGTITWTTFSSFMLQSASPGETPISAKTEAHASISSNASGTLPETTTTGSCSIVALVRISAFFTLAGGSEGASQILAATSSASALTTSMRSICEWESSMGAAEGPGAGPGLMPGAGPGALPGAAPGAAPGARPGAPAGEPVCERCCSAMDAQAVTPLTAVHITAARTRLLRRTMVTSAPAGVDGSGVGGERRGSAGMG